MTHVVLASDAGYLDHVACTLRQLSRHAPSSEGVVLLTPPDVTDAQLAGTRAVAARYAVPLEVVPIHAYADLVDSSAIARRDHVSAFTYSKLFMASVLPDHDEVLYLDVDTLVRDSLDELLARRLDHAIGGVHELGSNGVHLFGSTRVPYFNAGVLRMSLSRLREIDVLGSSLAILRDRPRLPFQDQDVLNLLFRDNHDVLPMAYNVFDSVASEALPAWKILRDPAIVHFVGPTKPWHHGSTSRFSREWRAAQAEALGMTTDAASAFVHGEPGDSRWRVAQTVSRMRHSPAGRRVRGVLPLAVKHAVNMTMLRVLPPRSRIGQAVRTGIGAESAADTWTDAGGATVEGRAAPVWSPSAHESPGRTAPAAAGRDGRSMQAPGRLILVVSLPRSGTTALNSMLNRGVPDLRVEGEFYYGLLHDPTVRELRAAFPWIGDRAEAYARTGVDDMASPEWHRYRQLANAHAVEVTRALLDRRTGPTLVKVFPHHLDPEVLDAVLGEFAPEVLILRRRLLFSYLSHLKATRAQAWTAADNTDTAIDIDAADVAGYIASADEWIDRIGRRCAELGIEPVRISYEGTLETGADLESVRELLRRSGALMGLSDPGTWQSKTAIQDRRTDASLLAAFSGFSLLPGELRADLLRYPGAAT